MEKMNLCVSYILFTHRKINGVVPEVDLFGFPTSFTYSQIDQEKH